VAFLAGELADDSGQIVAVATATAQIRAVDRRAQLDMARAHDRVIDAVVGGDSQRAWKEMDHHFTLNERIARRIAQRSVPGA
jgi:DNA-binding GntR family transcriptional regulator